MLETRLRFIDLATRPLAGKGAAEDLARGELMDRLAHSSPATGDDPLEAAIDRLEEKAPAAVWKSAALCFGAVLLLCTLIVPVLHGSYRELKRLGGSAIGSAGRGSEEWEERLTAEVDHARRAFLLRNTRAVENDEVVEWFRAAARELPDDPQEFEEFLVDSVLFRRAEAPFFTKGKEIDPENGLWALAEMSSLRSHFPPVGMRRRHGSTSPVSPEYLRAVALVEEAARAPRIESYLPRRSAARLQMLPPVADLADIADRNSFFARQKRWYQLPVNLNQIWTLKAEELAHGKDAEGLRRWIALWEQMALDHLRSPRTRGSVTQPVYFIHRTAEMLRPYAAELGMAPEEARLRQWTAEYAKIMGPLSGGPPSDFYLRVPRSAGLGYSSYAYAVNQGEGPKLMKELEPGLHAEHALADRFSAVAGAAVFAFLAFLALLEGWRRAAPVRLLAHGLIPLLRTADFAWLVGLGIAFPLAWHVGIMGFTPLGCRDYGVVLGDAIPLLARAGASLLLSLCLLAQAGRWRLAKRGGAFGLRPAALWPGWVVCGVAALVVPLSGLARYWPTLDEEYLACACAITGVPLLWLLWRAGSLVFGPGHAALGGVLLCRMVMPALLLGSLFLLGLAPLLKQEERRWVARDSVSGPDPGGSGLSRIDARSEEEICRRLLEAME